MLLPSMLLLLPRPHTPRRGRRIRDGLRPLPPTPKNKRATQLSLTLRNPAGLLVRSPGKPGHTTFLTVAGSPRRFSSVPPENRVTQLSSPWLHSAALLVRSGRPDDGSSQESFVLHRDQGTRQGTKQGTKQDSAPSGTQPPHFTLSFA